MEKTEMSTLWKVMETLRGRGYTCDFQVVDDHSIKCMSNNKVYHNKDMCIDRTYRFEGDSDPGDMSVLYALSTKDGLKGMYIDAYGAHSSNDEPAFSEFIKNVCFHRPLSLWEKMIGFVKNMFGRKAYS